MLYAPLTNKGRARLTGPQDYIAAALALLDQQEIMGEDPTAVRRAFVERVTGCIAEITTIEQAEALWYELTRAQGYVRVREPLREGETGDFELVYPSVAHYQARHGWGGKREGAGKKARREDGRVRVQKTITLDPDVAAAVEAEQHRGETYSETVERLLRRVVQAKHS
jgi:hypothetical protein